jgi:hypothetical protein
MIAYLVKNFDWHSKRHLAQTEGQIAKKDSKFDFADSDENVPNVCYNKQTLVNDGYLEPVGTTDVKPFGVAFQSRTLWNLSNENGELPRFSNFNGKQSMLAFLFLLAEPDSEISLIL